MILKALRNGEFFATINLVEDEIEVVLCSLSDSFFNMADEFYFNKFKDTLSDQLRNYYIRQLSSINSLYCRYFWILHGCDPGESLFDSYEFIHQEYDYE